MYHTGAQKRAVASEKKRKEDNIVKRTPKLTTFLPEEQVATFFELIFHFYPPFTKKRVVYRYMSD